MYSLLIVDDDIHDLSITQNCLPFDQIGITQVFTAQDISAAKHLIDTHRIHILVCDIEMPGGSGLDLLSHIRKHSLPVIPILLTCHTSFKYAHQAIKLGCLDYLLKPVNPKDLRAVLEKAVQTLQQDTPQLLYQSLWHKDLALVLEGFWLRLIHRPYRLSRETIQAMIENMDLPLTMDMRFFPLFIRIREYGKELTPQRKVITEYAVRQFIEETIGSSRPGQLIKLQPQEFLVLILDDLSPGLPADIESLCRQFLHACAALPCSLLCAFGASSSIADVTDRVAFLRDEASRQQESGPVFVPFQEKPLLPALDLSLVSAHLTNNRFEETKEYMQGFLQSAPIHPDHQESFFHALWQDFISALDTAAKSQKTAMQFTWQDALSRIPEPGGKNGFMLALEKSLWEYRACQQSPADLPIEKALHYIIEHLDEEDLSREMIAQAVYVSPDYLSRLFKQNMGVSITDYIITARIQSAERLLLNTNYSISTIATMVGYSHFSHFTKMFRLHTGYAPRDYRNRKKQEGIQS